MRTTTSARSNKAIIKVCVKRSSLIPIASWYLRSWKMVSSATTSCLKREITRAGVAGGKYLQGVVQSFKVFSYLKPSIVWAFSNIVCFTELYFSIVFDFPNRQKQRIDFLQLRFFLIKCTKHRPSLCLQKLTYKAYGDCLPLIVFVPSKQRNKLNFY